MKQLAICFDATESEKRRDIGMQLAAANQGRPLDAARQIAREIATENGITADDVVKEMVRRGYNEHALGNSAGSLFRTGEWRPGGLRKSERVHAHANLLRVWFLR